MEWFFELGSEPSERFVQAAVDCKAACFFARCVGRPRRVCVYSQSKQLLFGTVLRPCSALGRWGGIQEGVLARNPSGLFQEITKATTWSWSCPIGFREGSNDCVEGFQILRATPKSWKNLGKSKLLLQKESTRQSYFDLEPTVELSLNPWIYRRNVSTTHFLLGYLTFFQRSLYWISKDVVELATWIVTKFHIISSHK